MGEKFATPTETLSHARAHSHLAYNQLGNTSLWASQAGFGGYRITAEIARHRTALETALKNGINLIDTSANYADGGSESLIGQVLADLFATGDLTRQQVIIISKVGYLQGQNYEFSQQRKTQGKPFQELVNFGEGLEHCIHPEFLEDQLNRSLERLNLTALDFYLLHNPEYYLEWASKNGVESTDARREYYRRIRSAFEFLEKMVQKGRIGYYGVSSNTFPATAENIEFTCLDTLWETAKSLSSAHHFRMIQLPLNLLEPGAVLQKNQPRGKTVLESAFERELAVVTNRPLNAFADNTLLRLAEVDITNRFSTEEIIKNIRALSQSEKTFRNKILPGLNLNIPLQNRITEQLAIGDVLKHHWRHLGPYERWREVKNGHILARTRGVMDFLEPHRANIDALSDWMHRHKACLNTALNAVESIYSEPAALETRRISRAVSAADPEWAGPQPLSQKAVDAVRSTTGVSCVLVGMRRETYVADILSALKRPLAQKPRTESWLQLNAASKLL